MDVEERSPGGINRHLAPTAQILVLEIKTFPIKMEAEKQ